MRLCYRTGIYAVGDIGLIIDRLFFVECVAELVGHPLQLECQTGLTVANRPVCETCEHDQCRLARAHGGAVARRRLRRAGPAVIAADASGERAGVPDSD